MVQFGSEVVWDSFVIVVSACGVKTKKRQWKQEWDNVNKDVAGVQVWKTSIKDIVEELVSRLSLFTWGGSH